MRVNIKINILETRINFHLFNTQHHEGQNLFSSIGLHMTPTELKSWQQEMGLNDTQAAKQIGVSRQGYTNYINGTTRIPGMLGYACSAIFHKLAPWSEDV